MDLRNPAATVTMPGVFVLWQCDERRAIYEALERGETPRTSAGHLPVVSTLNGAGASFPIHSATKGVGLLPSAEYLAPLVARVEACLDRCQGRSPQETRAERIAVARSLYDNPEWIDRGALGSIEIFRGCLCRNLVADPRATLLFTGPWPKYPSYQFNCEVEFVGPRDAAFRFIRGMRLLFESEKFHIQQPDYPFGYVFHIREVFDKTPRKLRPGERYDRCPHRAMDTPGA
ncbi:MAG: hypothetical protein HY720_01940 [Planctomycetes bacterium]|nr:hypothetical protein [Planctomycetota bacterium]